MSSLLLCIAMPVASFFIFIHYAYADELPGNRASLYITDDFIKVNSTTKGIVQSLYIPKESHYLIS